MWISVENVDELRRLLAEHRPATIVGGGTILATQPRYPDGDVAYLSLTGRRWKVLDDSTIGAACRISTIVGSTLHPAIRDVASTIGSLAVRNQATVGGNVAWQLAGSLTVPLLALGARLSGLAAQGSKVTIDISDYLQAPDALAVIELVVAGSRTRFARSITWPLRQGIGAPRLTMTGAPSQSSAEGFQFFWQIGSGVPVAWTVAAADDVPPSNSEDHCQALRQWLVEKYDVTAYEAQLLISAARRIVGDWRREVGA